MNADENLIKLKHRVLREVAKLALEGTLDKKRDDLPFEIIEGPVPKYRCCIYKEREIIRQRIRLAEGKSLRGNDPDNIMQIIESACADCPISSYTVTDNCQNCIGKACINACRFGAIESGRTRSHIDPQKCRECGKCAEACPYNAIAHLLRPCQNSCPVHAISYNEFGVSVIDSEKCIRCGQCIHRCPFAAIGTKTFIVDVIRDLRAGKRIYAMLAPATAGQFGPDITMQSWRNALTALGFADCMDVSIGADMTATAEAEEWLEAQQAGENKVTSCCPGFVNLVNRHFPTLSGIVSETVSPMCALSRNIKQADPEAVTVFIGPCIAKKSEIVDQKIPENADYALTYSEINAILKAAGLELQPAQNTTQQGSAMGMGFAASGGVTAAVTAVVKEKQQQAELSVCRADGAEACRKALLLMKAGKLPEPFIEGMACTGGCLGGPSVVRSNLNAGKDRKNVLKDVDDRSIGQSLAAYEGYQTMMHR